MNIYWKDECKYCQNREYCVYKKHMTDFKEALYYMEKSAKGIYGRLRFNCDYLRFCYLSLTLSLSASVSADTIKI